MTGIPNLSIDNSIDANAKTLILRLNGAVDVTAGAVFDTLPSVPNEHKVILDFESVERVNSMGLAQLMRCLENWKEAGIATEAINLNRMISMLFKMTGLNRYFGGSEKNTDSVDTVATKKEKAARTGTAQFKSVKRTRSIENDKMTFSVIPQNNQRVTGWYYLNTLLQRRLGRAITMDVDITEGEYKHAELHNNLALHNNSIVFAKPFVACSLITNHNYIPIARPAKDDVEVSIVVRSEDRGKSIKDFTGASVATSAKESFVFLLGRFFCDEYGLDSSQLDYKFTGSQLTAVRRLLEKDVDMLFMLKDNYHALSELTREGTHVLDETDTSMAYHMLLLSPDYAHLESELTDTFLNLHKNDQGAHALEDLVMQSWCKPESDEIEMLKMLYGRYIA